MKLAVASGKGRTGKSMVAANLAYSGKGRAGKMMMTAALAHIFQESLVLADCDVDTANLELILSPGLIRTDPFMGMNMAVIAPGLCVRCGKCGEHCLFDVIEYLADTCRVKPLRCEGCTVCAYIFSAMQPRPAGEIKYSRDRTGTSRACTTCAGRGQLRAACPWGQENSHGARRYL